MQGDLLQEWTTVQAGSNVSVAQTSDQYMDVTNFQDLVFWVDIGKTTATGVTMVFETAPLNEETLFTALVPALSLSTNIGTVQSVVVLGQDAVVPPARWVRWRVVGTSAWTATFRIFISANEVSP